MTRFDERMTIDQVAETGPLVPNLVDAIADTIAASHAVAPPAPPELWIETISASSRATPRRSGPPPVLQKAPSMSSRKCLCPRFPESAGAGAARQRGYVRRCHGDLHLANIVLIEQSRSCLMRSSSIRIASVDVLYDLAFPIMDFIRYDRHAAANALLNRYLGKTPNENLDVLEALPLFMSLRAAIRANVLLARLGRGSCDKADVTQSARVYFDLAQRLVVPPPPTLVAIGGLSGTGKSVLARALAPHVAPQPGAVVLRTDVLRKQLFQVSEADRLPESAYQPEMTKQIYELLVQRALRILSQGHSVVADAVFARESERAAIRDAARRLNIGFVGLFLQTDLATRRSRVGRRKSDASDATPEIAGLQEKYDIGAVD